MSVFPNWEQYAVPQKRPESGCIPTGYEMLLRAAKIPGINFAAFQDEFDLDKTGNLMSGRGTTLIQLPRQSTQNIKTLNLSEQHFAKEKVQKNLLLSRKKYPKDVLF